MSESVGIFIGVGIRKNILECLLVAFRKLGINKKSYFATGEQNEIRTIDI
jgi:hypothetical protein